MRHCLGAAFALYEMRIVLRMLIERTSVLEPAGVEPDRYFRRAIVLGPKSGARVRLAA